MSEKIISDREVAPAQSPSRSDQDQSRDEALKNESYTASYEEPPRAKGNIGQRAWRSFKEPGSALQIVAAALLAIAIGLAVTTTTPQDQIPEAAPTILEVPGTLWLRALRATVLPLIITAIIKAMQNIKAMATGGAKLARWAVGWYIGTTLIAILHSVIMVDLLWRPLMTVADAATLNQDPGERADTSSGPSEAHDIVVQVATSFVPNNIVAAVAEDQLLAVLITSVIVGLLLKGPNSSILRAVDEVEKLITIVIVWLIKVAPIGVFFLILANLLTLDIADIGQNLGILIGASLTGMFIQTFIVLPALFFIWVRGNPYSFWFKCSPAWITAWGTASSAATLPVTIRCLRARRVPETIVKFSAPLGCLVNMDGTAIYFPIVVVFLAATSGQTLNAGDYVIIFLLSTLSAIATTPIPSSSLVLTVIIANAVGIEVTGMFAVVVAIDWFIDRFRTVTNVSGDLYAARVFEKVTGIDDRYIPTEGERAVMAQAGDESQMMRDEEERVDQRTRV